MKGIVLAAGTGSRLFPSTRAITKHLCPVYDKPMIYYSLSVQMLAGIRDVLIIGTPQDLPNLQRLLGDGSPFGMNLSYAAQKRAGGIAEALIIGESFLQEQPCCLILGDNLFYGGGLQAMLRRAATLDSGCILFGYHVAQPEEFGVVEYADDGRSPVRILEKPRPAPSSTAVTGLYFYDGEATAACRSLQPSGRGELEITDLNNWYLQQGRARIDVLGRGIAWLDTGTPDSLMGAAHYVQTIQARQGQYIACLEEIALYNGWIDADAVLQRAELFRASAYGGYLKSLIHATSPVANH